MTNYVYSFYDDVKHQFSPLIVSSDDVTAVSVSIRLGMSMSSDLHFYRLGTFNNETGFIEGSDPVLLDDIFLKAVGTFCENDRAFVDNVLRSLFGDGLYSDAKALWEKRSSSEVNNA